MKRFCVQFHSNQQVILLVLLLCLAAGGCMPHANPKKFTIGFSQCQGEDEWRKTMLAEMKRELSLHDDIEFVYRNAEADVNKQMEQIDELVGQKVDLLIVSPFALNPLTAKLEAVYKAGTPVVLIDRSINSTHYTAFVGASNFEVGQNAGRYAVSILHGKGKVVEVMGLPTASPFIDRHAGFADIITRNPGIQYVKRLDDHDPDFEKTLANTIKAEKDLDVIFAQSDYIAQNVYKVCRQLGVEKKIKIIGVDGLPNDDLGMGMVLNKMLVATVLYPTGGQEAMLTAVNILTKKPYKKDNALFTTIIDSSNVRILRLQNAKALAQQIDIDRRQQKIDEQAAISRNQANTIYSISFLLALALILGGITYYYLQENRKINKQLESQNIAIRNQQQQLLEMTAKAKEATEAKFNFFTNVSHEFRTPLTLIMAPLEELMSSNRLTGSSRMHVQLIQRNVVRLLRMVNQLIDFRKVELNKVEIKATQNDLVQFTREVIEAFYETAFKRGIDLKFFTSENRLMVWFDVNMIDKVLFNMLSNAIKFTKDDGTIQVFIEKSNDGKTAIVSIKDNGIGMKPEEVQHAFELFFQGSEDSYKGSGIGLSLSRELIELHKGKISLDSTLKKGTTVRIELPIGSQHLQPTEMVMGAGDNALLLKENSDVYTADLAPAGYEFDDYVSEKKSHEYTILLAEDNEDLLTFLSMRLSKSYNIITAENGNNALTKAMEELPDMIISDVMMPGKTGFDITKTLKSDVRTAHIPIILLTARTATSQQVEGYSRLADTIIAKPFSVEVLENNINSILANRARMKEHFSSEVQLDGKMQGIKKTERRFITDFCAYIEENIANENLKVEDICTHLSLSRVQLYRKVKALLDCNVNDYILNIRLQKAKYLLQHENLSVSEISFKVGFASASYFSTVFKSKFGITPSAFKDQ